MTGKRGEAWMPARDVRAGDRLVVSSTEVVNVERRGSEVVIWLASGGKVPMPAGAPVVVSRLLMDPRPPPLNGARRFD